jgi:hypothetical protein
MTDLEKMTNLALELEAENDRLRRELEEVRVVIEEVASAFEPGMDDRLCRDERQAVAKCREAAEKVRVKT